MPLPILKKLWLVAFIIGLAAGFGWWQWQHRGVAPVQVPVAVGQEGTREVDKAPGKDEQVTGLVTTPSAPPTAAVPVARELGATQQATLTERAGREAKTVVGQPKQWPKPLALPEANPTPPDPAKKPEIWVDITRSTNPSQNPLDVGA